MPERGFKRAHNVAAANHLGWILFPVQSAGNLGYFGHERALVIKIRTQQFFFRCAPTRLAVKLWENPGIRATGPSRKQVFL
jgi:hypothetical protein